MGVKMFIDIEGWDAFANAGMKQIFLDSDAFPKTYTRFALGKQVFRPSDFAIWRNSIVAQNINVEMWMRGLDALEANPDLQISYTY